VDIRKKEAIGQDGLQRIKSLVEVIRNNLADVAGEVQQPYERGLPGQRVSSSFIPDPTAAAAIGRENPKARDAVHRATEEIDTALIHLQTALSVLLNALPETKPVLDEADIDCPRWVGGK